MSSDAVFALDHVHFQAGPSAGWVCDICEFIAGTKQLLITHTENFGKESTKKSAASQELSDSALFSKFFFKVCLPKESSFLTTAWELQSCFSQQQY